MPFEIANPDRTQVAEIMRAAIIHRALLHHAQGPFGAIDPFIASALERRGVLAVSEITSTTDDVFAALDDPAHPSRRPTTPPGPLLFLAIDKDVNVLDPLDLLADANPAARVAAYRFFENLPENALAKRTRKLLEEARIKVISDDRAQWFSAAKGIRDILHSDYYLTLAGFKQAYAIGFETGVQKYLPQILRPKASLLTSVELDHWNPTEEYDAVSAAVRTVSSVGTLTEIVTNYYRQFGHVPLADDLGLGAVVRSWSTKNPGTDVWTALWAWADECPSPIPRYHVCSALLANRELVPRGSEGSLWGELAEIVDSAEESPRQSRWTEAWLLRNELAQHYGDYLECLLPGLPSERLMIMAWWLTERFSEIFPPSAGLLKGIRESTIASEGDRSSFVNHLTHPPVGRSNLRYMTRIVRATWPGSVLGELSGAGWLFERAAPSLELQPAFERALRRALSQGYPSGGTLSARSVYSFERPIESAVVAWTGVAAISDPEKKLEKAFQQTKILFGTKSLPDVIETLADVDQGIHLPCAVALRQYAYMQPNAGAEVWKLFHENSRWRAMVRQVDNNALTLVFEALTEIRAQHADIWPITLPHWYAAAAEEAGNEERRNLQFGLTLFSSLHAGTASAIDRLMHGPLRSEFVPFAARWHKTLGAVCHVSTPWARERIRALLPNLSPDDLVIG